MSRSDLATTILRRCASLLLLAGPITAGAGIVAGMSGGCVDSKGTKSVSQRQDDALRDPFSYDPMGLDRGTINSDKKSPPPAGPANP